jgi:K+-transporting ATPase KdpF subunit
MINIKREYRVPLALLTALLLNLAIAPAIMAAADTSRPTAYSLGILGMVILGLVAYLFVVIIQPERF